MVVLIGISAAVVTLLGGLFALRFKDNLHLLLGFSAGAVIALAFFDLIPEAIELAGSVEPEGTMTMVALGFLVYFVIDRILLSGGHTHDHRGSVGAASFVAHSFFDGLAVGVAFQVSVELGLVVTAAVLIHKLSDGITIVSASLHGGGGTRAAWLWLSAGSVAPVLGIIAGSFISFPETALAPILALFSGFFLYLGASELIPESYHRHPRLLTTIMTLVGVLVLYAVITITHT